MIMKKRIAFCLVLAIILILCSCGDNNKTYSATCKTCHKTYSYEAVDYGNTASHEVKCIRMTNMCKKCYKNYCYAKGITPKDY